MRAVCNNKNNNTAMPTTTTTTVSLIKGYVSVSVPW